MNDCDYCGGPCEPLGTLGIATWSKCRNCGAEHVTHEEPLEERVDEPRFISGKAHVRALRAARREAERGEARPKRGVGRT